MKIQLETFCLRPSKICLFFNEYIRKYINFIDVHYSGYFFVYLDQNMFTNNYLHIILLKYIEKSVIQKHKGSEIYYKFQIYMSVPNEKTYKSLFWNKLECYNNPKCILTISYLLMLIVLNLETVITKLVSAILEVFVMSVPNEILGRCGMLTTESITRDYAHPTENSTPLLIIQKLPKILSTMKFWS